MIFFPLGMIQREAPFFQTDNGTPGTPPGFGGTGLLMGSFENAKMI
jgi:hypothetical protein